MPDDSPAGQLLRRATRVLAESGLRWYLFGAQAVAVHGRPRLTHDVDVTVEAPGTALRRLHDQLVEEGFRLRVDDDPEAFAAMTAVLPYVEVSSGLGLDLVIAGSGLEHRALHRVVHVDLGGLVVPVISPEDLLVTKLLAQRPKDLEDARTVYVAQRDSLDLAYVRRTLEELEQALGQSDLVPALDTLLRHGD